MVKCSSCKKETSLLSAYEVDGKDYCSDCYKKREKARELKEIANEKKNSLKESWWKNKPYWLKGGIIGLIIFLLSLLTLFTGTTEGQGAMIVIIPLFPSFLMIYALQSIFGEYKIIANIILILTPLWYFLMGALIGWIVGKIKGNNR